MERKKGLETYRRFKSQFPDYFKAVEALGATIHRAGPLDERTIQLTQLAAAAAIRSEGAVHSHARRALEAGASLEDIRHALLVLTSTIGFPTVIAAMSWVEDVVGQKQE